jgi:tetratricopeptide (TPR) repeat protein
MTRLNERDPWGWFALGLVYGDLKEAEKAVEAYSRVLQLTPEDAVALNNRAWEALKLGKLELALADAQRATELEPQRPAFWHTLALIQLQAGQREAAQASLQRCLELDPQFQPAQAALQELNRAGSSSPTPLPGNFAESPAADAPAGTALPELKTLTPQEEPQPVDRRPLPDPSA